MFNSVLNSLLANSGDDVARSIIKNYGDDVAKAALNNNTDDFMDTLISKASEYSSVDDFKRSLLRPEVHRGGMFPEGSLKQPKKLYRGVSSSGSGVGSAGEGLGLYTTTDKKVASGYAKNGGKLLEMNPLTDIPTKPLYFRNSDYVRSWLSGVIKDLGITLPEFNKRIGIEKLVRSLGYDGVAFDHGNGVSYSKYADDTSDILRDIFNKLSNKSNDIPEVAKQYLQPVGFNNADKLNIPVEAQKYLDNGVKK